MLHAGINVNRYKLAQQLPVYEAASLACGETVEIVEGETPEECIASIERLTQEGLYFIGFDQSHVGFLLRHRGNLLLIHANYIGVGGVTIEFIGDSPAFASYRKFYLAPLSSNAVLMRKWLDYESVAVIEE